MTAPTPRTRTHRTASDTAWQKDTARRLTKLTGFPVTVDTRGRATMRAADLVRLAEAIEYAERDLQKLTFGLPY